MKCPTCRRSAPENGTVCERCGTELSALLALQQEFDSTLIRARAAFRSRDFSTAHDLTARLLEIDASSAAALKLRALLHLADHDFCNAISTHAAL